MNSATKTTDGFGFLQIPNYSGSIKLPQSFRRPLRSSIAAKKNSEYHRNKHQYSVTLGNNIMSSIGMFSMNSTAAEVISKLSVSLVGKNVVITGASSGIGLECAKVMANAGANIFMMNRNVEKSAPLVEQIQKKQCDEKIY